MTEVNILQIMSKTQPANC